MNIQLEKILGLDDSSSFQIKVEVKIWFEDPDIRYRRIYVVSTIIDQLDIKDHTVAVLDSENWKESYLPILKTV